MEIKRLIVTIILLFTHFQILTQELLPQEQVVYDFIMDMGENKDYGVKKQLDIAIKYFAPSFLSKNEKTLRNANLRYISISKEKNVNIISVDGSFVKCYTWYIGSYTFSVDEYTFEVVKENNKYYILPKNNGFINEYRDMIPFIKRNSAYPKKHTLSNKNKRWVNKALDYSIENYKKNLNDSRKEISYKYKSYRTSVLKSSKVFKIDNNTNKINIRNINDRDYLTLEVVVITSVPKEGNRLSFTLESNLYKNEKDNVTEMLNHKKILSSRSYRFPLNLTYQEELTGKQKDITIKYNQDKSNVKGDFYAQVLVIGKYSRSEQARIKQKNKGLSTIVKTQVEDINRKKFPKDIQAFSEFMNKKPEFKLYHFRTNDTPIGVSYKNKMARSSFYSKSKSVTIVIVSRKKECTPKIILNCTGDIYANSTKSFKISNTVLPEYMHKYNVYSGSYNISQWTKLGCANGYVIDYGTSCNSKPNDVAYILLVNQ